jgi:hypothetical protein
MKTFNVALLSDDNTFKQSHFFTVKAQSEEEAIQLAQSGLRSIMIDEWGVDPEIVEDEIVDYTPEIFELVEI